MGLYPGDVPEGNHWGPHLHKHAGAQTCMSGFAYMCSHLASGSVPFFLGPPPNASKPRTRRSFSGHPPGPRPFPRSEQAGSSRSTRQLVGTGGVRDSGGDARQRRTSSSSRRRSRSTSVSSSSSTYPPVPGSPRIPVAYSASPVSRRSGYTNRCCPSTRSCAVPAPASSTRYCTRQSSIRSRSGESTQYVSRLV